jgi:hypothetical protein
MLDTLAKRTPLVSALTREAISSWNGGSMMELIIQQKSKEAMK